MDLTWVSVTGVLIGIFIFALKVSLGCGFANLTGREMLSIATGYLVICLFMGVAIDLLPDDALSPLVNAGLALHLAVAFLLVALGIMTARKWNGHHHDISRRTFWILSLPCPACLAASFISCSFLASIIDMAPWKIGALVGAAFFSFITAFSSVLRRLNAKPSALGNAMIFLGLFYILSIILIPAYIGCLKTSFLSTSIPASELIPPYLSILTIMGLGFMSRRWGVCF